MGADDDLRHLRRRLLALVAAGVEVRAEMQLAAAPDLAAALLDRLLDLERVEGRLGIEAHQPLGIVRRGVRRRASLPEHRPHAERLERLHLLQAEVVTRHGIDHLAGAQRSGRQQVDNRRARQAGLAEPDVHRQAEQWRHDGQARALKSSGSVAGDASAAEAASSTARQ